MNWEEIIEYGIDESVRLSFGMVSMPTHILKEYLIYKISDYLDVRRYNGLIYDFRVLCEIDESFLRSKVINIDVHVAKQRGDVYKFRKRYEISPVYDFSTEKTQESILMDPYGEEIWE